MARAAIVYENLADAGTIDASSWLAAAPPALLQNVHVSRRWKGRLGDTEAIILDLLSAQSFDSLAVFGLAAVTDGTQAPMTSAAVTRARVSITDPTGVAGEVYDSGSAAGRVSEAYGALVNHLPAPITGRYVRFDLSQASAEAILAGRLVVGPRHVFTINFSYGWSFGYEDPSRKRKSAGGLTFVDRVDRYRVLTASFEAMEEVDRYGFVDDVDRLKGISDDIMWIIDPESDDPARDTIWGMLRDLSPPTQPNLAFFSKAYSIEERR